MSRSQSDFIDRSIETLFARGLAEADPWSGKKSLPQMDLSQGPDDPLADSWTSTGTKSETATLEPDGSPASNVITTSDGDVWLCGNVVMCGCPNCDAPVSVRLWLMVADCWNCESAIELSYEQQLAAKKLARRIPSEEPARPDSVSREPANEPPAESAPIESVQPVGNQNQPRRLVDIIRSLTNTLPAWLVSLLVHLVMILILALILLPQSDDPPMITLSTAVGPMDEVGGLNVEVPPEIPLEFDSHIPEDNENVERELREARIAADQDARELLVDPNPAGELPDIERVRDSLTTDADARYTFAARDPRLRNEIVRKEGGTTLSEAAVARGLRWLASVQNDNGSWSLAGYKRNRDENRGDAAATSLALLPFLGAGQTHEHGKYKETVAAGLKWLIKHQRANGELMYGINTNAAIYAHGQASIVLIEALAMTGDEQFREPAQKAIDYIEAFQHKHGGWRYQRNDPGDTSVLGWQLMALQSARGSNTGLRVDEATLRLADQYLDMASRRYRREPYRNVPDGTLYRYLPTDTQPKAIMTAEGLLCRMYLGWKRDDAKMMYGVDWLIDYALPRAAKKRRGDDEIRIEYGTEWMVDHALANPRGRRSRKPSVYYFYYATQVMHHFGGKRWEIWNNHLRDLLIAGQQRGGRYAGSWDPDDFYYGDSGGRIYVTALAICTLEVYYRHLPLFKQLDLE